MTTRALLDQIAPHDRRPLRWRTGDAVVPGGDHLTEIEATQVLAMDCGGSAGRWDENVLQILPPAVDAGEPSMTVATFLAIITRVAAAVPTGRTVESRMHLAGLASYPLKSGRGLRLQAAEAGPTGLLFDRRWMIVDADGRFVSQREDPRLGRIVPELGDGTLHLTAPGLDELTLPLAVGDGPRRSVTIWGDRVEAHACGPSADAWVSALLGPGHGLVAMPDDAVRPVDQGYAEPDDRVSFADGFPYLLTTTASLDELNRRAGTRLTVERFRPNLVVSGAEPFEEDRWRRIRVGEVVFRVAKPCARCVVTTLDPDTQEAGPEPLRTLARFRTQGGKVLFGQNLLPDGGGTLRLGAPVEVLEREDGPVAS